MWHDNPCIINVFKAQETDKRVSLWNAYKAAALYTSHTGSPQFGTLCFATIHDNDGFVIMGTKKTDRKFKKCNYKYWM